MRPFLKGVDQSDHLLEVIFSSLRWFFLVLSIVVFTVQYIEDPIPIKLNLFIFLVIFGLIYMGVSDYYLHKSPKGSKMYSLMTKGGPFFDYIAFSALVPLTGGIESPLLPLSYLIILHISVYWRLVGGVIAAVLFILVYSLIFFSHFLGNLTLSSFFVYFSQVIFILLVGFLGGIIVSRERKQHSEKNMLVEAVNRDYLTNLLNHRSFQECLRRDLDRGIDFYLALSDIDNFKLVNDKYGHVTGDKVLHQIGEIMNSIIPVKLGKVFRYGGEEFSVIIYSQNQDEVNNLLVAIKEAIEKCIFHCEGEAFFVTMSFGCCKQVGENPDRLVQKVDKLLYEAKDSGKNRIVYPMLVES